MTIVWRKDKRKRDGRGIRALHRIFNYVINSVSVVVHVDGDISIYRACFYTKDVVETQYKKAPPPTITASRGASS